MVVVFMVRLVPAQRVDKRGVFTGDRLPVRPTCMGAQEGVFGKSGALGEILGREGRL